MIMEITKFHFPTHKNDTGTLSFLEAEGHIPFPIRRVYYIYDVQGDSRRGFHAHKNLQQVLICIHGSCKILMDNGTEKENVLLDSPNEGLLIENNIWREMYDFSPGAVLLVLASQHYDESDYIRNYDDFLAFVKENEA
jgi:dTDP-4-dehydrorhamnose 3,5-epimerase-like enzyme